MSHRFSGSLRDSIVPPRISPRADPQAGLPLRCPIGDGAISPPNRAILFASRQVIMPPRDFVSHVAWFHRNTARLDSYQRAISSYHRAILFVQMRGFIVTPRGFICTTARFIVRPRDSVSLPPSFRFLFIDPPMASGPTGLHRPRWRDGPVRSVPPTADTSSSTRTSRNDGTHSASIAPCEARGGVMTVRAGDGGASRRPRRPRLRS